MPPNHIGRWTREAFGIVGERHGWHLAEHRVQDESFLPMARRFLEYRYLRASQRCMSVPNRIRRLPPGVFRSGLDAAWMALTLPLSVYALARVRSDAGGDSQWASFERVR
jgi:hypothetical protein